MSNGTLVRRTENGASQSMSDAIARRGHNETRIIHTSFKDLIPLRQREDVGDLERPSEEDVAATKARTEAALGKLITAASAAQKPKSSIAGTSTSGPTYVSYTPDAQMGNSNAGKTRIIKIVDRQLDPMEPPKHKHKKIPRGPPSPPPPIMHSPPRKLTAEDQEMWRIPPPVSNWKNPKGYTVPLDKRLAADGRGMQDATINDKFAQFSEALGTADRHAREEVKQRALMQQKLAEKEKLEKEKSLQELARQAREGRTATSQRRRGSDSGSSSSSRPGRRGSYDSYDSRRSPSPTSEDEAMRQREEVRRERRQENERQLRQSRMGTERRIQQMAREQNRDISEKVALGLAKPTQTSESMYDSRLFNQTSGFNTGFNEDQHYDRPLFAAQEAISSIYRPTTNTEDDGEDADQAMARIQGTRRFEGLGGHGATDGERAEGPVQFERDQADPFGVNQMIAEVKAQGGNEAGSSKRYGIQEGEGRRSKRARVDDDD